MAARYLWLTLCMQYPLSDAHLVRNIRVKSADFALLVCTQKTGVHPERPTAKRICGRSPECSARLARRQRD
jgi:hypothetical protein